MTVRGKYTGVIIDEFRVISAAHSVMDCLKALPSPGEIVEFPQWMHARDHANNALIDLQRSGVDISMDPTERGVAE